MEQQTHILIVDDERNMLYALEFILSAASYQVSKAENGQQAIDVLLQAYESNDPVNLLITDIRMPDIPGLQLIDRVRRMGLNLPILVITGHGNRRLFADLTRQGVTDCLDKPVSDEELLARVKLLIEGRNPGSQHSLEPM